MSRALSLRRALFVVGLPIGSALAACSLMTSLDGLTGGTGSDSGIPAPTPDANPGGDDDSGSPSLADDAASPTTGTDASDANAPPADAAIDAGTDAPILNPGPYCASVSPAPAFCDDFDETALAAPWDSISSSDGKATLDTSAPHSPPNDMLTTIDKSSNANAVDCAAYKTFPAFQGVSGVYELGFDFRIDVADESTSLDAVLGLIRLQTGSTAYDLQLEVGYGGSKGTFKMEMNEGTTSSTIEHDAPASANVAMATWTRASLLIILPATSGVAPATLSLNGSQVLALQVKPTTSSNPSLSIVVGPTYASSTTNGWAVRYDNVTFTSE